jgi:hypothetical protein
VPILTHLSAVVHGRATRPGTNTVRSFSFREEFDLRSGNPCEFGSACICARDALVQTCQRISARVTGCSRMQRPVPAGTPPAQQEKTWLSTRHDRARCNHARAAAPLDLQPCPCSQARSDSSPRPCTSRAATRRARCSGQKTDMEKIYSNILATARCRAVHQPRGQTLLATVGRSAAVSRRRQAAQDLRRADERERRVRSRRVGSRYRLSCWPERRRGQAVTHVRMLRSPRPSDTPRHLRRRYAGVHAVNPVLRARAARSDPRRAPRGGATLGWKHQAAPPRVHPRWTPCGLIAEQGRGRLGTRSCAASRRWRDDPSTHKHTRNII